MPIYEAFRSDSALAMLIARRLLDAHFPETMRSAILKATLKEHAPKAEMLLSELTSSEHASYLKATSTRRARDDKFRGMALEKYGHCCAVCNYSVEFPVGCWPALQAAHIKWHWHLGPDNPNNGISLCVLHHELFDWGLYTIEPGSLQIRVARKVLERGPNDPIAGLHRERLWRVPGRSMDRPAEEYLAWHGSQVFRDA